MKKALIIGAAFVDIVVTVPELLSSGGDVTGTLKQITVGGCAFNVLGAISHSKQNADLFVPIGKGQYATLVRQKLSELNIPILLPTKDGDNGWDICLIEPNGERSFLTIQGVEQNWQRDWFKQLNWEDYQYVYLSGYEMENIAAANEILAGLSRAPKNIQILFDASPRVKHIPQNTINRLMSMNVIINCNKDEINVLEKKNSSIENKVKSIYHQTHHPIIVTLGSEGTYYYDGDTSEVIPAKKAKVVNTIGAGDTHCGALIAALLKGKTLKSAIIYSNKLAAKVVEQENGSLS